MELNEIMRRIRLGDREALKALIARCGGDVYKRALAKTGDKALAKEITQKTFAELVTMLQRSEDDEGWQLWLDTLAGRNIDTCARIKSDVSYVKNELERELYQPALPPQPQPGAQQPGLQQPYAPRESYRPADNGGYAPYRAPAGQAPRPQTAHPQTAHPQPSHRQTAHPQAEAPRRRPPAQTPPPRPRLGFGYGLGVFVLIVLCLVLLWAAAGICMNMNFLPKLDLGYAWFNTHVFPFF